jgi:dihydrolipoamide dehydrogenase
MKKYDLIVVGSGSAMNIVEPIIQANPSTKIAAIDKDEPGGICLTRGCIPSKIMLYPTELAASLDGAEELGIDVKVKSLSYQKIMKRMRELIDRDINAIRNGLSNSENIDYYHSEAEFIAPYQMKVENETITAQMIFLATGSRPYIPKIDGLDKVHYHTSDSVIRMEMKELPRSLAIIGGGYIAAEFGHFFATLGSEVTIIGRNPQFLPEEEPEVSALVKRHLGRRMKILTNHVVQKVTQSQDGTKTLSALDRSTSEIRTFSANEILIAAGREPVNDILKPELGGVKTTPDGWIKVNEFLETSQPNVWALGDADGQHLFRHVANYESEVVYYNAILKRRIRVDYSAVPHAVFTYPEVASVGMREKEAIERVGTERVLIGYARYEDTAKGEAMNAKDYFVKVIVDGSNDHILGAHIVGPYASILVHEIIAVMYTREKSWRTISDAMHIHPALSEVVQRAVGYMMPVEHYHEHFSSDDN